MIADSQMTKMLNIRQVRDMLGLSYAEVIALVQSDRLRAYRYAGSGPIHRNEVTSHTPGLRFRDSDIQDMRKASLIN